MNAIELVNRIGVKLTVQIEAGQTFYDVLRTWGQQGWSPTMIPAGGIPLPYAMADTFDWRMIGARPFAIDDDGEKRQCVEHLGMIYKRRDFAAVTRGKKMPAKVTYSRGARPTDPSHLCEGATGDNKGYVTLVQFVGNGPSIVELERGRETSPQRGQTAPTVPHAQASAARDVAEHTSGSQRPLTPQELLAGLPEGPRATILHERNRARLSDQQFVVHVGSVTGDPYAPLAMAHVNAVLAALRKRAAA